MIISLDALIALWHWLQVTMHLSPESAAWALAFLLHWAP